MSHALYAIHPDGITVFNTSALTHSHTFASEIAVSMEALSAALGIQVSFPPLGRNVVWGEAPAELLRELGVRVP